MKTFQEFLERYERIELPQRQAMFPTRVTKEGWEDWFVDFVDAYRDKINSLRSPEEAISSSEAFAALPVEYATLMRRMFNNGISAEEAVRKLFP